jgi:hypothetical protein
MNLYLLKAGSGFFLLGGYMVAFILFVLLAEAAVMFLFKLNRFGKTLLYSFMANIGSFLLFILLFLVLNKQEFDGISQLSELVIFYLVSCLFEAWIIRLLSPELSWGRILPASFVMNLVSFAVAYLVLTMQISI